MLEHEDEIGCAVGGCNFLLRTITHEAFNFEAGQAQFVPCSSEYIGVNRVLFRFQLVLGTIWSVSLFGCKVNSANISNFSDIKTASVALGLDM